MACRSARSPPATGCSRSSTASPRSRARPTRRLCPTGNGRRPAPGRQPRPTAAAGGGACTASTSSVEAGRVVALVGPTGSGKTSLVALLARLYDPSEGTVEIDGADLRDVELTSLRSQIAFVADDSFLFSASVAENIAYAKPDATPRGDRARRAARPGARLHRAAPRRLRHARRRARPDPLGRAAPADRDRAGPARRSAHPDPRRRHIVGRRDDRGGDPPRPRRGARAAGRRSSSPTASRRSRSPTRSSSSTRAASSTTAPTRSCSTVARSTARSPTSGSPTAPSCSATSSSARRWRDCERTDLDFLPRASGTPGPRQRSGCSSRALGTISAARTTAPASCAG